MTEKTNYVFPAEAVSWSAVRAAGPGGQNVNKVASAVQLRLDLSRACLPVRMLERFKTLFAGRLTADGVLVIRAQTERSQGANLRLARQRLEAMLDAAAVIPSIRRATRPTRASVKRRLEAKAARSAVKKSRSAAASWE